MVTRRQILQDGFIRRESGLNSIILIVGLFFLVRFFIQKDVEPEPDQEGWEIGELVLAQPRSNRLQVRMASHGISKWEGERLYVTWPVRNGATTTREAKIRLLNGTDLWHPGNWVSAAPGAQVSPTLSLLLYVGLGPGVYDLTVELRHRSNGTAGEGTVVTSHPITLNLQANL